MLYYIGKHCYSAHLRPEDILQLVPASQIHLNLAGPDAHIDYLHQQDQFKPAPRMRHLQLHAQWDYPLRLRLQDIELEVGEGGCCALELRVELQGVEEEMPGEDDALYFEATAHFIIRLRE